ncbi:MAG: hypothetical protein KAV87_38510, partial [Desulfobacteraceae bacterium]|nr:hypothetical protein [Desulfobacteraceae bacterium]
RGKNTLVNCSRDDQEYEIEAAILKPQIKGGDMKRFLIRETPRRVLFPYSNGKLIPATKLRRDFPLAWKYLNTHKDYLKSRESGKMKGPKWYAYTRSQALDVMWQQKIITPEYYAFASFCYDEMGTYYFFGGGAGGYAIVLKEGVEPLYILGLLNSKLLDWYLRKVSVRAYSTAYLYVKRYIEQLPIADQESGINFTMHKSKIVELVKSMIGIQQKVFSSKYPNDLTLYKRQLIDIENKINSNVYKLYGLDNEEKTVVESEFQ